MMPRLPISHPVVHPAPAAAPAPAPAAAAAPQAPAQGQENAPPGVLMHGLIGARPSALKIYYLVAAAALQCLWSLALSILYIYALLVGRTYHTTRAIAILCAGDWITGALTFTAACASAGITTFVNDDVEACFENHCPSFMAATAMAFLTWFAVAPCCVLNLASVVHRLQRA